MTDPLADLADTPLVTLLASVDNALRNGSDMSNANLAFELLCDRLGVDRDALVFDPKWSTTPEPPKTPCPEGFHWIGQSFACCDQCTLPAWEHEGMAVPSRRNSPFDVGGWVLKPWGPGERESCKAKWGGGS